MSSYFTDFFLAFNLSVVFGVTLDGCTSFVDAWFKVLGSKPRGAFVLLLRFYISSPTQKYLRFSVSVSKIFGFGIGGALREDVDLHRHRRQQRQG